MFQQRPMPLDQNRLTLPFVNRPEHLAPINLNFQTPATPSAPTSRYLSPAAAGLAAGQSAAPSYDTTSAAINVGTSIATGAASGAMVGGPVGAAVGGGLAGLVSLANAYTQVSSENKRRKEQEKLMNEIKAKQARVENQARVDGLEQRDYDRKQVEQEKVLSTMNFHRNNLLDAVNKNAAFKQNFIRTGIL